MGTREGWLGHLAFVVGLSAILGSILLWMKYFDLLEANRELGLSLGLRESRDQIFLPKNASSFDGRMEKRSQYSANPSQSPSRQPDQQSNSTNAQNETGKVEFPEMILDYLRVSVFNATQLKSGDMDMYNRTIPAVQEIIQDPQKQVLSPDDIFQEKKPASKLLANNNTMYNSSASILSESSILDIVTATKSGLYNPENIINSEKTLIQPSLLLNNTLPITSTSGIQPSNQKDPIKSPPSSKTQTDPTNTNAISSPSVQLSSADSISSLPSERCVIYTFFEILKFQISKLKDHLNLLRLWMRNWYHSGFEPQILTMKDAQKHPKYNYYRDHFSKYPTVNDREYELVCYLRWLALREAGGGTMIDFDMFSFDYQLPKEAIACGKGSDLVSHVRFWPMLIHSNPEGVDKVISRMHDYKVNEQTDRHQGMPHLSDMIILGDRQPKIYHNATHDPRIIHFASSHLSMHMQIARERAWTKFSWANTMLQYHFLNTHRLVILQPPEIRLMDQLGLECPLPQNIEYILGSCDQSGDKSIVLPRWPQYGCEVRVEPAGMQVLKGKEEAKDTIYIVLVHQQASCTLWPKIWPKLHSGQVLPLLLDSWDLSKILLEYSLGFVFQAHPQYKITQGGQSCREYPMIRQFVRESSQQVFKLDQQLDKWL